MAERNPHGAEDVAFCSFGVGACVLFPCLLLVSCIFLAKPPHKAISCGFFFFSSVTTFCLSLLFFPFSFLWCSFFFF